LSSDEPRAVQVHLRIERLCICIIKQSWRLLQVRAQERRALNQMNFMVEPGLRTMRCLLSEYLRYRKVFRPPDYTQQRATSPKAADFPRFQNLDVWTRRALT